MHAAEAVAPDDQHVKDMLEAVHTILDNYKDHFGSDIQGQQVARIQKFNGYGLSVYELMLLNDAGIPPWYGFVKVRRMVTLSLLRGSS